MNQLGQTIEAAASESHDVDERQDLWERLHGLLSSTMNEDPGSPGLGLYTFLADLLFAEQALGYFPFLEPPDQVEARLRKLENRLQGRR